MNSLKRLKKIYDRLENDKIRSAALSTAEYLGIRKDIIRLDTNNFCNISCIMCNRSNTCTEKHYLPLEQFKSLLALFAKTTRILYLSCACEPLVTPHFTEYLEYAKSLSIPYISLCTNGLLLQKNIVSCLVDQQIDEIIISFNGYVKTDYNRIMKGSDYDRIYDNLKQLNDYKKAQHSEKPLIRLNTMLMKSNLENATHLTAFVSELGINSVQFRELIPFEDQNDPDAMKTEYIVYHSPEERTYTIQQIQKIADDLHGIGVEVILPLFCGNESGDSAETQTCIKKETNTQKCSCSVPFFSYWIDCSGNVRVCGYDEKGIVGNAFDQDFKSLLSKRRHFQKMALAGECSSELCTMNMDTSVIK